MTSSGALLGDLNEHDDDDFIEKYKHFHWKWVISIKQQMMTAINFNDEHVLQKNVCNNNFYMPQLSRKHALHFHFRIEHQLGAWSEITQMADWKSNAGIGDISTLTHYLTSPSYGHANIRTLLNALYLSATGIISSQESKTIFKKMNWLQI